MIEKLLRKEVQDFLVEHEQEDEKKLILKHRTLFGLSTAIIADQLSGRRKAKVRLPLYYNTRGIVFPPGLNLEQSSSEKTAQFKAALLDKVLVKKNTLVDLTGGFGVDAYFLGKILNTIHFVEPNASLLSIAQHNHQTLGAVHLQYHHSTAENFLNSFNGKVDCVFIDPSRRSKTNQKVFKLSDCEPDVPNLLSTIFQKSDYILIKASPLLDIQEGIKELKHVEKVWVVSVDNECKELLFFCRNGFEGKPNIIAVNVQDGHNAFEFNFTEEKSVNSKFSEPLTYLYEPNTSILKAGPFKLIGEKFSLFKLHASTHLYTSKELNQDFPGRIFKIIQSVKPSAKNLKETFPEGKANVITRNYPLTTEELKKKTKLKDGGALYLLGFSGQTEKYLVAAERIK
jgi:16S rRNA G966 N2-methylase RsmD